MRRSLRPRGRTFACTAFLTVAAAACHGAPRDAEPGPHADPSVEPGPVALVYVEPGTTTQIHVQKAAAVDAVLREDAKGVVEVTVARPDGGTIDLVAPWTCTKGVSTRRSIAEAIAAELQRQLAAAGLPDSFVKTAGSGVIVSKTPKGYRNTGTPGAPLLSPRDPKPHALHTLTHTTDKDGK